MSVVLMADPKGLKHETLITQQIAARLLKTTVYHLLKLVALRRLTTVVLPGEKIRFRLSEVQTVVREFGL